MKLFYLYEIRSLDTFWFLRNIFADARQASQAVFSFVLCLTKQVEPELIIAGRRRVQKNVPRISSALDISLSFNPS
jgi:hypothetical protein